MNLWICLQLAVDPEDLDLTVEALWELETIGIEEEQQSGRVHCKAYFLPEDASDLARRFEKASRRRGIRPAVLSHKQIEADPERWIQECKARFQGFHIGATFHIHPSWEEPDLTFPVRILIEPGAAFGTGSHESTQLCLLALEKAAPLARRILDLGTGSGILSIAASQLNHSAWIVALDRDPDAVASARLNLERNRAVGILPVAGGPECLRGCFDLVVANLTLEIFRRLQPDLFSLTAERLILSGFTVEQTPSVRELFPAFEEIARLEENEWVCLELLKPPRGVRV